MKYAGVFLINEVPADASMLLCGRLHCRDFLCELLLLKLVSDWSLAVLIFVFLFLLHLYSIYICNGWKINVSDVPVNVNKIKPVLKGARCEWCDERAMWREMHTFI